jgi:hypothetical protein
MLVLSRRLTATFVCIFILGAITGSLIALNFADLRFYNFLKRTNDPAALAQRLDQKLTHDYQLDADEQARIAPLTRGMAQKLYALRRQFGTDVLATLDEAHEKIGAQMNPAQRTAYAKANDDRHKRAIGLLMPDPVPSAAH